MVKSAFHRLSFLQLPGFISSKHNTARLRSSTANRLLLEKRRLARYFAHSRSHTVSFTEWQIMQRHPDVARSMHDLAELYHEQGKFKQAEKLVHKALVIREQLLGPDHSDVARSLTTLAKLHFSLGRYPLYFLFQEYIL